MNIEGQEGLYDFLNSQELYTKSLEEFKDQFSTPEKQSILYERLSSNGLYDKSEEEFTNQFFGVEKKNPIETEEVIETEAIQPDQIEIQSLTEEPIPDLETPTEDNTDSQQVSEKPKSSSAGGMLQMATPSASESQKPKPGQSQGQLLMAPVKGKKIEDVLKQEKKKWDVTSLNWFNPNKPVKIDIPTVTKNVAEASKNLAQKSKELEKNRIQLESEVKAFENAYKANPKDPNLPKLKLELDKKLNAHNALSSQFQLDINNVNQDRADIKKAMAEKFIDEKDKGSFLGATWNSIVEGYKKIGESQARIAIDLGIELLNSVGIPVSADKKMTKDEAKKAVISEMMPILSKGYDVAKSKGTTEAYIQQQKTKGVLPKAWFGVAESLPVMASGGGTVGRFVTGASMAYQYANEELDSNPNTANMDENERKKITVPIAVIGGVLEELGFRTLIGKNKPALIKLSSYIVKQLPTNATIETIKEVTSKAVKGPIMKEIVSTGTKLGTGYLGEAETGGAQKALDVITKEIYDSSNNVEFFKNPEIFSKEFLSKVAEDANIEGLGGVMMRGIGIGASTAMSVTGVGQMSDKEYAAWKDLATNEASGQLYLSKVIADLSTGRITKPEAEKRISDFNRATEIAKQIPDNLSVADQKKAFSIIAENQKIDAGIKDLQKYMEGKNPNLVTNVNKQIEDLQKRIQDNNTQLTKLSENAVQEQTTSQVPVQPEAGTSQQVAEGEPQAEPQSTTQEGQGQEVAPTTGGGGMIQMAPGSIPSQETIGEQPTIESTTQIAEEQPTTGQQAATQDTDQKIETISKNEGVSPKDLGSMYQIIKEVFGLNDQQALASSVVMDRMVDAMAKRAGINKAEMYQRIKFKRKDGSVTETQVVTPDATAQVTSVQESPQEVKPTPTQKPAFENVEVTETIEPNTPEEKSYVEEQSSQPILWTKIPAKKGDPKIAARNKVIMQAAQDLLDGKITNEQYREIVQRESPIVPIEKFFEPATEKEVNNALSKDKVGLVDSPTEKGTVFTDSKGDEFEITSNEVGLRLDIPAFINNNTWVVTVHGDVVNKSTGKKTKDKAISYGNVARITDVTFDFSPTQAIAVATKKQDKVPFLKMRGKMAPIEGNTMDERAANAKKIVAEIQNNPAWTQIGSNPFKHSGFFNRATGNPILSADEVIQIGGLVYAKNVKETTWDNPIFEVKGERGKPKPTDAAGKNVLFQEDKASIQIASDGTAIITALTDPNVVSPLHELSHLFEHYLTDAERNAVIDWAGGESWSTNTSEKFARGFEKYLADGKAPNASLQTIFDQFKQWLISIYNGIKNSEIDIELNDAMKNIYKSMISDSSESEIKDLPGYERMMGEVNGIIDKSLKRGVPFDKAMDNAIQYMSTSKVYENATDTQREEMVRDIRKMFNKKEKKAPTVAKLGLKEPAKKALVDTKKLLDERLVEIDQSIKEGQRNFKQAVKDMAAEIKGMLPKGVFSARQLKIVANALSSNLLNPKLRQEAIDRVSRMVNNVVEATKLKESYDLRTKIRKANVDNLSVELQDLAKGFAQIDPRYIDNLDEHLDQARQVFDAIRNVKFKKDEDGNTIVDPRSIIPFAPAQDYTEKQLKKQEEIIKDALLQQYSNLVDEGKINDSMSLAQIQDYVKSLAEDPSKSKEEKDQALRDYAQQSFDESKEELQDAIDDGAIDEDDVPLIEGFTKMDLSLLDPMQAYEAAESLMNYRVNGSTSKMGKVLANYVGALGVKTITENVRRDGQVHVGGTRYLRYKALGKVLDKLIQGLSFGSLKTNLSEKFGSAYSDLWLELNGTLDNLGVTYFGPNNWRAIKEASGLDDIIKGVVQRKIIVEQFRKEIHDKYKGKKIGKDGVFTTKNAYMLGILSNLYRQTSDAKQKDTYFDKRKKVLRETIDYLLSSEDNDERKKGELLNEIYEELDIENATNGKEIFDNADPVAKQVINDFINKFKQYYPSFSRVAQQQFNILLGQDQNYTPDSWINVGKTPTSASDKLFKRGNFTMNNDIVDTEETGRFIKPKYPDGLPKRNGKVSRIASYDFFQNNMDAFAETVNTVKTINGVNQYVGFVDSPEFSKLITNEAAREFFKDRVNYNVSLYQMNEKVGKRRGYSKGIVDFFKIPTKLGTTVGLSSIQSMATQSLPIVTNTVLNLRNPAYMLLATQYLGNKDMQEFLNNSDYGISERGHSAQTNIDYADNMLERGDYSTAEKTKELLKKASRYWVDKVLVGTDVLTAKTTWMAYYMDELAKQGINPLKIDWKTHEINDKAAKYAETMVQREQNVNLPESGGKLWSSKDSRMRLARMLMPFASFTTSQKDKIKANMAVLFMDNNLATKEEKIAAARSIVASAGEQYIFNSIKSAILTQLMAGAYGIADEKETEEEEKLRKKKESFKLYADIFDAFNGSVDFLEKESGAIVNNFLLRATENLMNLYEYAVENNMTLEELKKEIKKMNWGADNKIEKDEVQIYPFGDARAFKTQAQIKRDKLKEELKKPFRFYESEEASSPETVARMFGGVPKAAYDTWARFVTEDLPDIYSKSTTSEDGEEAEFTQEDAGKLLMAIPIKVGAGFGAIPREIKNLSDYTTKIIKDKTNINYKRRRAGRKREMKNMYN